MAEKIATNGYIAIKPETTKGTAVIPTIYTPYYDQSIATDFHLISDEPIYGNKFKRLQSLQGLRSHTGSLTVMAEANTAAHWLNIFATKGTTTGSDPYTQPFTASATTDPKSATLDISMGGGHVIRFIGVEASKFSIGFDGEKMVFKLDVSGLKSFYGREISSISTTTVHLKTDYGVSPTDGLVATDLVSVVDPEGAVTKLDTTISSITDADTVVLGASAAAFAAGDMLILRPATPSYTLQSPFIWGKTQFFFSTTATQAQTDSGTASNQVRLEPGTEIVLMHEFEENEGAKRSGDFDPAALVRLQYDLEFNPKKFFDNPDDIRKWNARTKRAMVMRSYTGATSQYELRVTLNDLKTAQLPIPTEAGGVIYEELEFWPNYDTSDGQGFDVKVLNALSAIS